MSHALARSETSLLPHYQDDFIVFANRIDPDTDLLHAVAGMVTEVGELREWSYAGRGVSTAGGASDYIAEAGDCWWFTAFCTTIMGWDLQTEVNQVIDEQLGHVGWCPPMFLRNCLDGMEMGSTAMLTEIKRRFAYGAEIRPDKFYKGYQRYIHYLTALCEANAPDLVVTLEDILKANLLKLDKRYEGKLPDGSRWKSIQADVRNESAEMEVVRSVIT